MLVRRFNVSEIRSELRAMLSDWREERGLPRFGDGSSQLTAQLDAMARNHSVNMADVGKTIHVIYNTSSTGRYRANDLYWNCGFERKGSDAFVRPDENAMEVLGLTYAGRTYEQVGGGTDYNANETAVARDIFEQWTNNSVYRPRLSYHNATRIGIGIEITRNHEVYATGNVCVGPLPPDETD
jgi:hypothetical protein